MTIKRSSRRRTLSCPYMYNRHSYTLLYYYEQNRNKYVSSPPQSSSDCYTPPSPLIFFPPPPPHHRAMRIHNDVRRTVIIKCASVKKKKKSLFLPSILLSFYRVVMLSARVCSRRILLSCTTNVRARIIIYNIMCLKANTRGLCRHGKEASVSEAYIPTRTAVVGLSPEPVDTRELYYFFFIIFVKLCLDR